METLGTRFESKLNHLQTLLPEGLLVDSAWLQQRGYSRALIAKYVASGWLESPARSVYRRASSPPLLWRHVVISLQTLLGVPVHVGGLTALELLGYGHYLRLEGHRRIELYAQPRLPSWLGKLPVPESFAGHSIALFDGRSAQGLGKPPGDRLGPPGEDSLPSAQGLTAQPWGPWDWPLIVATPERAALELLDELPKRISFQHVDHLFEGLANLSPRRLNTLLAACRSVKVKRLFLWYADRHRHGWLARIDRARIDLGSGKRMLVRGGRLDPTYQITVPESLSAQS